MGIAGTVETTLTRKDIDYSVLKHPHTSSSSYTAQAAHVTGDQLAKAVVLKDHNGYLLAVLPATHALLLDELNAQLHRQLSLASEGELEELFYDCERGAVPPLGPEYGLPTVVDEALRSQMDIYFEAGDHVGLVHVSETSFEKLIDGAEYLQFSRHVP